MKRRPVALWAACLLLVCGCGSVAALDSELETAVASPASDIPLQLANAIVCMGYNFRLDLSLSPETRKLLDVTHLIMVPSDVVGTRGSKGGRDFFTMDVPSKEQTTFETLIPDTMVKGSLYYETVDLEPNAIYSALLCQKIAKHGEFYRTLKCGYRVDIVTQPGSKRSCLALNAWSLDFIPIQIVDKFPKLGVKGLITSFADVSSVNLLMSVESETRATDEAPAQTYVRFQTDEGGLRFSLHLTSTEPKWNNPGWCNISVSVHAGAKLADMRFLKRKDGYNIQVTSTVSPAANDVSFELDVDDHCSIPALKALKNAILRQKEGGHSSQFTSLASLQSALQKDAESADDSFQHIAASTLISGVKDNLFLSLQQLFRSTAGYIAQNPCFQRHYFANVQDRLNKVKFGLGLRYRVRQDSTMQLTLMSPLLKEIFGDSEAANKFGTVISIEPEPDHFKTGYDPIVHIASQISSDIFEPLMMRFSSPYNMERLSRLVDRIKNFLTPAVFALDTPEFILAAFHCGPEHPFWTCNPINKNLKPRASSSTGFYLKYDPTEYEASTFHYAPIMRLTDAQTACVDILGAHALVDVDKNDEEQSALIRRTLDLALAATKKAEKVVKESKRRRVANALAAMQAKGGGAGSDEAQNEQSVDADVDEDDGKDSFIELDAEGIVGSASGSTLSESSASSSGSAGGLHNWTLEWLALRGIFTPLNGTKLPIHSFVTGPADAATFDLRVEFSRIETELDSAAREVRFLTGEKTSAVGSGTEGLVLRMTVASFTEAVSESAVGFVADNPSDPSQLEVLVTIPANQEIVRAVVNVDSKNRIHLETTTGSLGSHMRIHVDWKNPRNAQWLRKHYPKANAAKAGQQAVVDALNTRFLPRLLKRLEETLAKITQFYNQHPCMQKYFVDGEDLQAGSAVFRLRLEENVISIDLDFKDVFAKILNKKVPVAMRRQGLQFTTQYLGGGTIFLEAATGAKHAALADWSRLTVSLGEILSYGMATQAASRATSAIQTAFELYSNFTSYSNQFWTLQWPENPWQAVPINHTFPCLSKLCDRSNWENLVSALKHWGSGTPGGKDLPSLERQYAQNQLDLADIRAEQLLRVEGIQRAHGAVLLSASDLTLQLRGLAEAVEKVKLIARGKYNPEDDRATARPKAKALSPIKVVERYQRKVRAKADLKKIMNQHEKLIITANTKFAETDKVLIALLNREFIARGKVIGAAMAIEAKYNSLWPYVPALLPKMWTDSHLARTVIAHPPPRTPFNASVHVYSDCYLTVSKEYTATGACVSAGDCKAAGWFSVPWREGAVGCLRWSRQHKGVNCCMDPHQLTKKAVHKAVESSESGESSGHLTPSSMSHVRFAARRSKVPSRLPLQP